MNIKKWVRRARLNGSEFYNALTVRRLSGVHYSINEKVNLQAWMEPHIVNGEIGVVVDSMDCDCTQAHYEIRRKVKPLIMEWWWDQTARREAEGPRYVSYRRPDEVEAGYRRTSDRALAAYEDGNMSRVTWTDLSPDN